MAVASRIDVVATAAVRGYLQTVSLTPSGTYAYITIQDRSNRIARYMVIDSTGARGYVVVADTNGGDGPGHVAVVDLLDNVVIDKYTTGFGLSPTIGQLALSPDGDTLYAVDLLNGNINVIDTATGGTTTIKGSFPNGGGNAPDVEGTPTDGSDGGDGGSGGAGPRAGQGGQGGSGGQGGIGLNGGSNGATGANGTDGQPRLIGSWQRSSTSAISRFSLADNRNRAPPSRQPGERRSRTGTLVGRAAMMWHHSERMAVPRSSRRPAAVPNS